MPISFWRNRMITYFDDLLDEEKEKLTAVIRLLLRQTYVLERKYDKKVERFLYNKDYRTCEKHLDFLKDYFSIGGLDLVENRQLGIIALDSMTLQGDKLSKLTTIFVLLLKLIYDEQMNTISNSTFVFTTLNEIYNKIRLFKLWDNKALPITEVRKTVAVLKRYQVIDIFDYSGDLEGDTKLLLYPTINLLLDGNEIKNMITLFSTDEVNEDEVDSEVMNEDFLTEEEEDGTEI